MFWIHHHHMIIAFIALGAAFAAGLMGVFNQAKDN